MKVLIVGAGGQLGRALVASAPPRAEVNAPPRSRLDLTVPASIDESVSVLRPEVILNAAAYTQVDRAESEPDAAFAVNAVGVASLARAAVANGSRLLHVSTDYVFDGHHSTPYSESDRPAPLNVYGHSKLEGERHVATLLGPRALTIRTSWLYGPHGGNFLATMLRLMRERPFVSVVCDQVGTPTSTRSLASALWSACDHPELSGVLHWADAGVASWYDFAMAIAEEGAQCRLLATRAEVRPISSSEYPTKATRPAHSVLDWRRASARLAIEPVHWRVRLREVLREIACRAS